MASLLRMASAHEGRGRKRTAARMGPPAADCDEPLPAIAEQRALEEPNGDHPVAALLERWETQAEGYTRDGVLVGGGALLRRAIAELRTAWSSWEAEPLGLQDAARESGYSPDHLARLLREGTVPNAGAPYGPRILRRDLPRKPGHSAGILSRPAGVASRLQIVRSVVESETEEDDG